MFGHLRWRIDHIEGREYQTQHRVNKSAERIRKLEEQVAELTKALEWHVGAVLEIILTEEKLIKLRVEEAKERGDTNVGAIAERTYENVEQSVSQQLDNNVRTDTGEGQDSRE